MGQTLGAAAVMIGSAGRIGSVMIHQHPVPESSVAVVTALHATGQLAGEVFVGRADQVEQLCMLLAPADPPAAGAVVVSAVAGMGGVGKTALARYAGGLAVERGWFGGGAVFVDLRGYDLDGTQIQPDQVFAPLLRTLGVPGEHVPTVPSEQAAAYHHLLGQLADDGQRVLVVLDNAATADQVRDLLPRQWQHRGLVTTRDTLTLGGARQLDLDVLAIDDALNLLEDSLIQHHPADRRAADQAAAVLLVKVCGQLPLALEITAALLAGEPALSLADFVEELGNVETRLDVLRHGDRAVAAAFERSWLRLLDREPQAARLLRLLTLNPGPDIAADAAAALADQPSIQVRTGLRVLRDAHLLQHTAGGRWRMHDLVRLYAHRQLIVHTGADDPGTATTRLFTFYRLAAAAANEHIRALPGQPVPDLFATREEAVAWLDAERASLTAVAFALGTSRSLTTTLAACLAEYQAWRRHFVDRLTNAQDALTAAHNSDDAQHLANAWNNLGAALLEVWRFDEATTTSGDASGIQRVTHDRNGEGSAWKNLGLALLEVERVNEAITAFEQAVGILRVGGDRHGEGEAWYLLGQALKKVKRFDEARQAGARAADAFAETGDLHIEGIVQRWLGDLPG